MSGVTASKTQPMLIPWSNAARMSPSRLLVTLERRVAMVVEDQQNPIAEIGARVLMIELVAHLTMVTSQGRPLEQKRVRAHGSDAVRFAAVVIEQMDWACQSCPGITLEMSHDTAPLWEVFLAGLELLPVPVYRTVERMPVQPEDLDVTRRARRRTV